MNHFQTQCQRQLKIKHVAENSPVSSARRVSYLFWSHYYPLHLLAYFLVSYASPFWLCVMPQSCEQSQQVTETRRSESQLRQDILGSPSHSRSSLLNLGVLAGLVFASSAEPIAGRHAFERWFETEGMESCIASLAQH